MEGQSTNIFENYSTIYSDYCDCDCLCPKCGKKKRPQTPQIVYIPQPYYVPQPYPYYQVPYWHMSGAAGGAPTYSLSGGAQSW